MNLKDIKIRTELQPGDIEQIIYLHGLLYKNEYGYDLHFESYVADGLNEFVENYNPEMERVWICEHNKKIIGSLFLENRNESAQLRYFFLLPDYRGIGLGKNLMELFIDFLKAHNYRSSYLWTTKELNAAANIYKKYGFKLTEEKKTLIWGKEIIEQKYELNLSGDKK